eukprot:scaffold523091_cov46-Prasinocladus_malaysianus.AAC.2
MRCDPSCSAAGRRFGLEVRSHYEYEASYEYSCALVVRAPFAASRSIEMDLRPAQPGQAG